MSKPLDAEELLDSLNNLIDALETSKGALDTLYNNPVALGCAPKKILYSLDSVKDILGNDTFEKNSEHLDQILDSVKDIRSYLFSRMLGNDVYRKCCTDTEQAGEPTNTEDDSSQERVVGTQPKNEENRFKNQREQRSDEISSNLRTPAAPNAQSKYEEYKKRRDQNQQHRNQEAGAPAEIAL